MRTLVVGSESCEALSSALQHPASCHSCPCEQSTRNYLLERKSFQGATVYFLMSQTLAVIYSSGLTAAGAVVVNKLGPE
jgi:hypothetical protein